MPIADIIRFLQESLGTKLTSFIAGVDPKTVSRWTADEAGDPRPETETKLRETYRIFQLLQSVESPHTIRAWFMGMNPQLDDQSPAEAIAAGDARGALAAARVFVTNG